MRVVRSVVAVAALTLVGGLLAAQPAHAVPGAVVISQVYGGGSNAGSTYNYDFIELFNRSDAPVDISGWSVEYGSATGSTWTPTPIPVDPPTFLAPGQYLFVLEAGTGTAVPDPDVVGTITMSASAGKVRLLDAAATQVDLVGYGSTANMFETAPAPGLSNSTADRRLDAGCTDTDNNATDFEVVNPATPRNSATTPAPCGVPPGDSAPTVTSTSPTDNATGVAAGANITVTFSEPVDTNGSSFTVICATSGGHAVAADRPRSPSTRPQTSALARCARSPWWLPR